MEQDEVVFELITPDVIGGRIRLERERLKLKAVVVYSFLDIHQNTFYNYEIGKRDIPSSLLANLGSLGFDLPFIMTGETSDILPSRYSLIADKPLSETETKRLKMLVDIQNKLDDDSQKQVLSKQIDQLLELRFIKKH